MPMIDVRLHGPIGKKFGRYHRFDANSPAEVIRALRANFRDFDTYLLSNNIGYKLWCGVELVRKHDRLFQPVGAHVMRIVQVPMGSGTGLEILLGSALVGSSMLLTEVTIANALVMSVVASDVTAFAIAGGITTAMSTIGWALIIGGVSSMLFKPAKGQTLPERPENMPSYAFNGAVNSLNQGGPVPLAYGEIIVGSKVISGGLYTEDIAV